MTDYARIKEENSRLADAECAQRRGVYQHYPEVLQIELTDRCNGRCIMCKHYYKGNHGAGDLAKGVLAKLEEYLPFCRLVLLNGYGESLISSQYRSCMDLLKKYQVKAFVTSNLSVFTREMEEDAQTVFEQISVSCHGSNKEDYERISQGLTFETFTKNLERLSSLPGRPQIALSVVAMAPNIAKAEEMVEFAAKYRVPEVRYGRLGINQFLDNGELDLIHYEEAARYYFGKAKERADALGIRLVYPENYHGAVSDSARLDEEIRRLETLPFRYTENYRSQMEREYLRSAAEGSYEKEKQEPFSTGIACRGICDWAGKGMYIDKNGFCYTCCETKEACYGRISEDSLEEIRNGQTAQEVRRTFGAGELPYFCINCPFVINRELKMLEVKAQKKLYVSLDYKAPGKHTGQE